MPLIISFGELVWKRFSVCSSQTTSGDISSIEHGPSSATRAFKTSSAAIPLPIVSSGSSATLSYNSHVTTLYSTVNTAIISKGLSSGSITIFVVVKHPRNDDEMKEWID